MTFFRSHSCIDFIKQVKESSNIHLKDDDFGWLSFTVDECNIFQIIYTNRSVTENWEPPCEFWLLIKPTSLHHISLIASLHMSNSELVSINGFLEETNVLSAKFENIHTTKKMGMYSADSCLEIRGEEESISIDACGSDYTKSNRKSIILRNVQLYEFYLFAKINPRVWSSGVKLLVQLFHNNVANSWADVMVTNVAESNWQAENSPLLQYHSETIPLSASSHGIITNEKNIPHVVMLHLNMKHKICLGQGKIMFDLCVDYNYFPPKLWISRVTMTGLLSFRFVSIPGIMSTLNLHVRTPTNNLSHQVLRAFLIQDNYKKFSSGVQSWSRGIHFKRKTCDFNRDLSTALVEANCFKLPSNVKRSNHSYFVYIFKAKFRLHKQPPAVSWEKADNVCNSSGGNLPFFTNREELEEILAHWKLFYHIYEHIYVEGIFIQSHQNMVKLLRAVFATERQIICHCFAFRREPTVNFFNCNPLFLQCVSNNFFREDGETILVLLCIKNIQTTTLERLFLPALFPLMWRTN